jgi:transposase InsO family protein
VVAALKPAGTRYGVPECIRVDNGPEFISKGVDLWAYAHGVVQDFSPPGKPTNNPLIESFNSRFRRLPCLLEFQENVVTLHEQPGPRRQGLLDGLGLVGLKT